MVFGRFICVWFFSVFFSGSNVNCEGVCVISDSVCVFSVVFLFWVIVDSFCILLVCVCNVVVSLVSLFRWVC